MSRSAWAGLLVVFVVAATARVGWVAVRYRHDPATLNFPDEQAYLLSAHSLAAGDGLIDEFGYRATYMPAYPAFLAVFDRLGLPMMTLRIVQAVLGALVAPATYMLAFWILDCRFWISETGNFACLQSKIGNPKSKIPPVPLLAGLAAALDPFLVFFSGLLLTETLFAVVLVTAWWLVIMLLDRNRPVSIPVSVAAGLCLLGCIMLRPSSTIVVALAVGMVLVYRRFAPTAWLSAGVMTAVVVLGLSPWAWRNAQVLGEWRWTTTRGGISLYDGLQPGAVGASDLAHTKMVQEASNLSELAWDAYWRDKAVAAARQDPVRVLKLAGRKFVRMWNITPNEENSRKGATAVVSAVWMTAVLATAVVGLWRIRRAVGAWIALLAPVAAFTLLHAIFIGSVRYRVPLMPMVGVLSALGLSAIAASVVGGRSTGGSA